MVSIQKNMCLVNKMARILISYYSDYGETMYDSLFGVLRDNGNDVFRLNINNPGVAIDEWGGCCSMISKEQLDMIVNFNPEIIFNFNHSLPINLLIVLSPDVINCVIDADNPNTFWNKDYLKSHYSDYYFLGLQSYSKEMYDSFLNSNSYRYLYFPPGTAVVNREIKQDKNISFIGSNFYPLAIPPGEDFYSEMGLKLYDALKENYYLSEEDAKNICSASSNPSWLLEKVRAYYVGQDRLKHMQVLTDLGFTFYGVRWWNHIAYYDFELAKCFDSTPIITLEDNQYVYNSSKLSVNISHPQAKTSFSWRVMDIMASNSCLLMEDKPDWRDLFEKYLSSETLDLIIYNGPYDLRSKVIYLLSDEDVRKQCVKELNSAIDNNGRWNTRFIALEKMIGIKITYLSNDDQILLSVGNTLDNSATIISKKDKKIIKIGGFLKKKIQKE